MHVAFFLVSGGVNKILAEIMVVGGSLNSSQWLLPLWKSKKHINEHKMNGSWWYIEVLWSETTGLCKNLNIITCNAEPQTNSPEWCPLHERIIRLNRFFLVNYLIQIHQSASEAVHGSSSTELLNQNRHSDSTWATSESD